MSWARDGERPAAWPDRLVLFFDEELSFAPEVNTEDLARCILWSPCVDVDRETNRCWGLFAATISSSLLRMGLFLEALFCGLESPTGRASCFCSVAGSACLELSRFLMSSC